jgi:hypothetical protein
VQVCANIAPGEFDRLCSIASARGESLSVVLRRMVARNLENEKIAAP